MKTYQAIVQSLVQKWRVLRTRRAAGLALALLLATGAATALWQSDTRFHRDRAVWQGIPRRAATNSASGLS